MNQFLNQVNIEGQATAPSFVRSNIDTNAIVEAGRGTSGSKAMDIMFDTAIKISEKLEGAKRAEEKSRIDLELNNAINDVNVKYEGLDVNSPEIFRQRQEDYEKVHADIKAKLNETTYTTREDVDQMNAAIDKNQANMDYKMRAEKAQYDVKETISKNNATALASLNAAALETNEERSREMTNNAINAFVRGNEAFMSEGQIRENVTKLLAQNTSMRIESQMANIMNSNLSIYQKRDRIEKLKLGLQQEQIHLEDTKQALKGVGMSESDIFGIAGGVQATVFESFTKAGGVKERLDDQIRQQEYQEFVKTEATKAQLTESMVREMLNVDSNVRGGNPILAINTIEEKVNTPDDLMNNPKTMTEYFGKTNYDIVQEGNYTQMYPTSETTRMKQEMEINNPNGTKRFESMTNVMEEVDSYDTPDKKENVKRSLIAREVITPAESYLYDKDGGGELINDLHRGEQFKRFNKIVWSEVPGKSSELRNKIQTLTPYQQDLVSQAFVGQVMNSKVGWDSQTPIDAVNLNAQYRDIRYKAVLDNIIEQVRAIPEYKSQEVKIDRKKVSDAIEKKYRDKNIYLNQADGMKTVNVQRPGASNQTFTESLLD